MCSCPICSSPYREGRQCPAQNGAVVCVSCCAKCKYHRATEYGNPCRWHAAHPAINYDAELEKLERQINSLWQKIEYYYKRSWRDAAAKKEHEIGKLLIQKRKLTEINGGKK